MDRILLAPICGSCSHSDNEWFTCDGRNCKDYQEWKKKRAKEAMVISINKFAKIISEGVDNDDSTREIAEKIYNSIWGKR